MTRSTPSPPLAQGTTNPNIHRINLLTKINLQLALLLGGVAGAVEKGEQQHERNVHKVGCPRCPKALVCATTARVNVVKVDVDIQEARDELHDLPLGEVLLPPHCASKGGHKVVQVHEEVDNGVHDHAPQAPFQPAKPAPCPGQPHHHTVVPQMERDNRLLSQDEENRINQLIVL